MSAENVAFALAFWPRLYLDTAELLYIGDGKYPPEVVIALVEAMDSRGVILVLSLEHLQDALPRATEDSVDRLCCALERFSLRAAAYDSPGAIEPWGAEIGDIVLQPVNDVRAALCSQNTQRQIRNLTAIADVKLLANQRFQEVRVEFGGERLSGRNFELYIKCLVSLAGRHDDLDAIITSAEHEMNHPLSAEVRSLVRSHLVPAHELANAGHEAGVESLDVLQALARIASPAAAERSPGTFLASRLGLSRVQNVTRLPQPGDFLDELHASYFPYVDIATCDKQTFACVAPHLAKISGPRKPALIRNGRLAAVVQAVLAFPKYPPVS